MLSNVNPQVNFYYDRDMQPIPGGTTQNPNAGRTLAAILNGSTNTCGGSPFTFPRNEFTLECLFRTDEGFHSGTLFRVSNANGHDIMQFTLGQDRLALRVEVESAQATADAALAFFPLNKIGRMSNHYLKDGNWHHLVVSFTIKTGEIQLYIDGESPPEFKRVVGTKPLIATVAQPAYFFFSNFGIGTGFHGDLDEVALYDRVLDPAWIYQHYQDAMVNQTHYQMCVVPLPEVPCYHDQVTDGLDSLNYPPGYPIVDIEPAAMLAQYPAPRYKAGVELDRNFPDFGSFNRAFYGTSPGKKMKKFYRDLATYWNYSLPAAAVWEHPCDPPLGYTTPMQELLAEPEMLDIPRSLKLLTRYMGSQDYPTGLPDPWVVLSVPGGNPLDCTPTVPCTNQPACEFKDDEGLLPFSHTSALPDDYYYNDGAGGFTYSYGSTSGCDPQPAGKKQLSLTPNDPTLLPAQFDADLAVDQVNSILAAMGTYDPAAAHIEYLTDEGEMAPGPALINCATGVNCTSFCDADMQAQYMASGFTSTEDFIASQKDLWVKTLTDPARNLIAAQNASLSYDPPIFHQYNIQGGRTSWFTGYPEYRNINMQLNGSSHPTPYFYPQSPVAWALEGDPKNSGMNEIAIGRIREMDDHDDHYFAPYVSPGIHSPSVYIGHSNGIVRPGTYLGLLKLLEGYGADYFHAFVQSSMKPGEVSDAGNIGGNHLTWKIAMPSYAQGVLSYANRLFLNSENVPGQTTFPASASSRYTFTTQRFGEYVLIREHNTSDKQLIFAASPSMSNWEGGYVPDNITEIDVPGAGPLRFKIRQQGSIYYHQPSLDLFYPLDFWHENKDPYFWCKENIWFEAEVEDKKSPGITKVTEQAPGAGTGDYVNARTYVTNPGGGVKSTFYNFVYRQGHPTDFYLHALASNHDPEPADILVYLDGVLLGDIVIPPVTVLPPGEPWAWAHLKAGTTAAAITLPPLVTGKEYQLEMRMNGKEICLDKLILSESDDPPNFDWTAAGANYIEAEYCGLETRFNYVDAATGLPFDSDHCMDWTWDFGDGSTSKRVSPVHTYDFSGEYDVTLTIYNPMTGDEYQANYTLDIAFEMPKFRVDKYVGCADDLAGLTLTCFLPGYSPTNEPPIAVSQAEVTTAPGGLTHITGTMIGTVAGQPAITIYVSPTRSDTITVTHYLDPAGECSVTATAYILIPETQVGATYSTPITCGVPFTVTANNAFSYEWFTVEDPVGVPADCGDLSSAVFTSLGNGPTRDFTLTEPTTILIRGSDVCGCSSADTCFTLIPEGLDFTAEPYYTSATTKFVTLRGVASLPLGSTWFWKQDGLPMVPSAANQVFAPNVPTRKRGFPQPWYNPEICLNYTTPGGFTCETCKHIDIAALKAPEGIAEIPVASSIKIHPNPSSGRFTLDFDLRQKYSVDIQVVDLLGNLVFETRYSGVQQAVKLIDLGAAADGVYLLRAKYGEEQYSQKLLLKR